MARRKPEPISSNILHLGTPALLWRRKRPDGTRHLRWSYRFTIDGKTRDLTTKETDLQLAEKRVREVIGEILTGYPPEVRPGASASWATIADILICYQGGTNHASKTTLRTNANSLIQIARTLIPSEPPSKSGDIPTPAQLRVAEQKAKAATLLLPATILTRDLAETWMKRKQGGRVLDRRLRQQINISINSTYKHARDVFARKLMSEKYAALKLPDLTGFLTVPTLPIPQQYWTRIPRENYAAMVAAAAQLEHTDPDLWLCNLLIRRIGLRNSELAAAKSSWLVETDTPGIIALSIQDRPDFQLKGVRPRTIPLSADLASILKKVDGHLLMPAANKTDRLALIERRHNIWLRQFIPDRTKGNHELRKHAGSLILTKQGLPAAQRYLGHSSQQTTERWYATYLQDLPALTAADEAAF